MFYFYMLIPAYMYENVTFVCTFYYYFEYHKSLFYVLVLKMSMHQVSVYEFDS